MKNTIRILSLVLCLAMLVGVFAASAFATEATETVLMEEKFDDQPGPNVGKWSGDFHANAFSWVPGSPANPENQHVKLTHNNPAEGMRVYIGAALDPEDGITFPYGKIAAKDLTFDAKIEEGTDMRVEFYVIWNLTKSDDTTEQVSRRVTIDVADGKIYNSNTEVGTIPAAVDITEWHTWTIRVSRQTQYSGTYNVQVMIDGIDYVTGDSVMTTQGNPARERFAVHARSVGSIEIDNMKVDELLLDAPKGTVTTDSVVNLWKSGFGALGTELTYDDVDNSYTPGQWKRGTHENTSITMVEDEAGADEGGYLVTSWNGTSTRYANKNMDALIPVDETAYVQLDVKLNNEMIGFQVGGAFTDKGAPSGRLLYVNFRPDGLYYHNGNEFVKADFEVPTVTEWNTYIFKCIFGEQRVVVYANGTELGTISFRNYSYSTTGTNYTQFKITAEKEQGTEGGTAYIDNIKVSYGVDPTQTQTPSEPQGPSNTADASIIGLAAMMLPVSGFGISALALKRKKEN